MPSYARFYDNYHDGMVIESTCDDGRTVTIPGLGLVRGIATEGVIAFRDIPYAAPPVGGLRFAPSVPVEPWSDVFDATMRGPVPPQSASRVYSAMGGFEAQTGENCLSLSIWTPDGIGKHLPVMVWIHGGGFMTGAASLPWYDGGTLAAAENVVMVGINYRIGALGYLSVPGCMTGNFALYDQILALNWVKEHIRAFGGDPENITLMGESGGAHSIASLLSISETQGLFRRAILQSAPLSIGLADSAAIALRASAFLDAVGVDLLDPELMGHLRALPVDAILAAQLQTAVAVAQHSTIGDLRPPVLPTPLAPHDRTDEDFVRLAARRAAERGVDILIGWTKNEANLFMTLVPEIRELTPELLVKRSAALWGEQAAELLAETSDLELSPADRFCQAITDANFRRPSLSFAETTVANGGRVFVYQFDWESPMPGFGACHCLDIPFALGSWKAWMSAPMMAGADMASVASLSHEMMHRWASFARTGNPGFPAWNQTHRPVMHFDNECWLESAPAAAEDRTRRKIAKENLQ